MEIEELVLKIQQGNNELMGELWDKLRGLIAWYAKKFMNRLSLAGTVRVDVETDDLIQSGYFAIVEAVKTYNPERGSFNAHLYWYIKIAFKRALGRRNEPLNNCVSLDIPINADDPDGPTRLDYIPDQRDLLTDVEARVFQEQLHKALESALDAIPEREAAVIRAEYWENRKHKEIAQALGVSYQRIHQMRNDGFRHIRKGQERKKLEQFIDFNTPFYMKVSVDRFTRTGTSAVEALVIAREEWRRELLGKSYSAS